MKKLIWLIALLPFVAIADSAYYQEPGTVVQIVASSPELASIEAWRNSLVVLDVNPQPLECGPQYIIDGTNAGLVKLLADSRRDPERILVTIEDPTPGARNVCFVRRAATIN